MSYKAYNNRTFGSFFVSNTCNKIDNVTSVDLYVLQSTQELDFDSYLIQTLTA